MRKLIVLLLFVYSALSIAQTNDEHLKKHIGFMETFFGNEQDYQVCYPKDHKNFFYSIIGFALLSTSLGAAIIIIKTRSNKLLKEKNTIIEEKNHDLISSITYARRIQTSILPHASVLKSLEERLFVFYKPRDIVSGDFYWMHQDGDIIYTAVVDCTGHGVPGAFLSLIGQQAINRAVKEEGLKEPSDVLDSMNTHVKNILKQEENTEVRDGMEVAICKFNCVTRELKYAGANLGLVFIQGNQLNTVKAAKCTVGSVQPHVKGKPETHTIQLQAGDTFYCFSDGYADQMGGDKQKKFMSVKLRELLLAVSSKPLQEQCMQLTSVLESWKGDQEQTDDICVLGVRA